MDDLWVRELNELVEVEDPAWPVLLEEISRSAVPVEVLPADVDLGRSCLLQMQVTVHSFLGAVAAHSGGLLLDGGWLRLYGSGSRDRGGLLGLAGVNRFPAVFDPSWSPTAGLVVAHDVLGGVFALNGADAASADRPGEPGEMVYFAPDSLEWEALECGYSAWLMWMLSGTESLDRFYSELRWPGWREELRSVGLSQGISVIPFLWTREAQQDLAATSRRPVPLAELLGLSIEFCRQLGGRAPGFLGET